MHLQVVGYFSRRLALQAHQNPLDAEHDSWLLILLCLPSKFQQLGDGGPLSFSECWAHIPIIAHFADYVELFMRTYIADAERGLELLCDVLELALKVHSRPEETEEDYSWIWRSQLELEGHGDPKDSLVSAVRDAAVLIAELDPAKIPALLNALLSRRWRVFRRIAAHVLKTTPNIEPAAM